MKRRIRRDVDLRLKIAIIQSRRTQRQVSADTRIVETRLSQIVGQRGSPPTAVEKERLAKYLGQEIDELFPVDDDLEQDARTA